MKNVLLAVCVVLAGAGSVWLWKDLREQRTQGSELAGRIAALEGAPGAAGPAATSAPQESTEEAISTTPGPAAPPAMASASVKAPAAGAAAPAPRPAGPQQNPQANPRQGDVAATMSAMQTPQGQNMVNALMRSMLAQTYPDIAEGMDMSQQEADALFELLARHQSEQTADSMSLVTAQEPAARIETQRRLSDLARKQQAELQAHLGDRYGRWEDYRATAAVRQVVNTIKASLAATGNPLSDEQTEKLVVALAPEQKRLLNDEYARSISAATIESPNYVQESLSRTVDGQRRMVELARPHLTAEQFRLYSQQMEQQLAMLQGVAGALGGQGSPAAGGR